MFRNKWPIRIRVFDRKNIRHSWQSKWSWHVTVTYRIEPNTAYLNPKYPQISLSRRILKGSDFFPTVFSLAYPEMHASISEQIFRTSHGIERKFICKIVSQIWNPGDDTYREVSDIRGTLVGNKIVDHSDVVGASPVGAAPTTSSFST